jgi:lactoylglutathione lyase
MIIYDKNSWWNIIYVSNQSRAVEFYTQKLGFEAKSDMLFGDNIKWIEVAPKESNSTLSLVEPNRELLKTDEEINRAKLKIGTDTDVWFYANDIESTYEELKGKGIDLTKPEKQDWGGIMSILKDQDGNLFGLISAPSSQ